MKRLPRSFEYRSGDTPENIATRLAIWTRDVIQSFARIPDVVYTSVTIPSAGEIDVTSTGTPRSVVVARVEAGTVSAAPGIEWEPIAEGFRITAVHGVAGAATLSLRVEV
jgi:hypothetical protein